MFKLTILLTIVAFAHAGVIAPVVPVAHPVVAHPVVAHPVVAHPVAAHPVAVAPVAVSHSSTLLHHGPPVVAPIIHAAPVVPVVKHTPIIAVHH